MRRSEEIQRRIEEGNAVILTASELKERISAGESSAEILASVDVVTCGTCGVMSGTYTVLSVPVAPPGSFTRADTITLNGVPAIPGPCPNERLGLVDCIVYGTAHRDRSYGGGHLFEDLAAGREIEAMVTSGGREYQARITLDDLPHARLFTTRSAFRNYSAIINGAEDPEETIFSVLPLAGGNTQATVSGCGEINPLENDPTLRFLPPGSPVVVNGAPGRVIGTGTRSSDARPNLSVHADIRGMDPAFCGGFVTSAGPECITSIGTAIPLLDESALSYLTIRDAAISLPVLDISDRQQVGTTTYDHVWQQTAQSVRFSPDRCRNCDPCQAAQACPVRAIREDGTINQTRCFVCGTCVSVCEGGAYEGTFGSLPVSGSTIPIVLRQSDRRKAEILCRRVRDMIQNGEVTIQ